MCGEWTIVTEKGFREYDSMAGRITGALGPFDRDIDFSPR